MHCFVSLTWGDWDVLLPAAEFVLNSIYSASTRHSPAFVLHGHQPVFPFEHAICSLVDINVASVADCV